MYPYVFVCARVLGLDEVEKMSIENPEVVAERATGAAAKEVLAQVCRSPCGGVRVSVRVCSACVCSHVLMFACVCGRDLAP